MALHPEAMLSRLERWFGNCPFAIVACSGGEDSCLVSFLANRFLGAPRNQSVMSDPSSLKRGDLKGARAFRCRHQIPLEIIQTTEVEDPNYFHNPTKQFRWSGRASRSPEWTGDDRKDNPDGMVFDDNPRDADNMYS